MSNVQIDLSKFQSTAKKGQQRKPRSDRKVTEKEARAFAEEYNWNMTHLQNRLAYFRQMYNQACNRGYIEDAKGWEYTIRKAKRSIELVGKERKESKKEYKPGDSFFGGRERTVHKLKDQADLNPVKKIESPQDFKSKLPYIPDVYEGGPRDVADTFDRNYNSLTEEAKEHYLGDRLILKRLNAYRRAFNDWRGRAVRYYSIPSPVEAGPSKYPYNKLNKAQKSFNTGTDNLEYRKKKLIQALRGAVDRALKSAGTSQKEMREAKESKENKEVYDQLSVGTIVESPLYGQATVVKKNRKSIVVETGGGELRIPYHMLKFLKIVGQKKEVAEQQDEEKGVITGNLRKFKHKADFQYTNYPVYGFKEEGREDTRIVFPSKSNNHVMFSARPVGSEWKVHWEGQTYRATKKLFNKGFRKLPCLVWEV